MTKESLEPTITDVFNSMQRGFAYVEERFNHTDARIDQLSEETNERFVSMNTRFDNIDARLGVVERDMKAVKSTLGDIQEDLATLSVAFDRDSETLVSHDKRIEKLEVILKVA